MVAALARVEGKAEMAIRRRMTELRLSQADVGKAAGNRSHSWTNIYLLRDAEKHLRRLWTYEPDSLASLLAKLQWTEADLAEQTGIVLPGALEEQTRATFDPDYAPVRVLVLPEVEAGAGLPSWDDNDMKVRTFLPRQREYDSLTEEDLFRVRVKGDSMYPTFKNRQAIVFRCADTAEEGDVVAIHVPHDGLMVKRLVRVVANPADPDRPLLFVSSDNPKYSPDFAPEGAVIRGVKIFSISEGSR